MIPACLNQLSRFSQDCTATTLEKQKNINMQTAWLHHHTNKLPVLKTLTMLY